MSDQSLHLTTTVVRVPTSEGHDVTLGDVHVVQPIKAHIPGDDPLEGDAAMPADLASSAPLQALLSAVVRSKLRR
jgi:hypothetical protein